MAIGMSLRNVAILAVMLSTAVSASNKDFKKHIGKIVDMDTGHPLGATVSAWSLVARTGFSASCPVYGKALAGAVADGKTGDFVLSISAEEGDFQTTACLDQYFPRTDGPQDRDQPSLGLIKLQHRADLGAYRRTTGALIHTFIADITYVRANQEDEFRRLSEDKEFLQAFKDQNERELARRILFDIDMYAHLKQNTSIQQRP